ncbi:MAG: hypothetical protein ACRCZ4_12400 [Plesiomonas sp.]|uniref:hypothetical protein n=1 Tax=Plesiomonas sp. TaxID=2486279 RepID=UPI003F2D46B6
MKGLFMVSYSSINEYLDGFFLSDLDTQSQVRNMRDSLKLALANLLDGDVITTSGNNVEADHYMTRASSLVDVLENEYSFPIEHKDVSTLSELTGKATIQTVYYIKSDVIAELRCNAKAVFSRQGKIILVRREARTEKLTRSLISKVGGPSNAVMYVLKHHVKDDDVRLEIIQSQIDAILSEKSYR